MAIVRLRGPLKRLAGDRSDHPIDGATVGELLHELEQANPAVGSWILDERGSIRRHINVFVNGEGGSEETPVDAGDRGRRPSGDGHAERPRGRVRDARRGRELDRARRWAAPPGRVPDGAPARLDRRGEGPGLELYFGTTTGEVFGSADAGASWFTAATHLPPVYSVRVTP